MLKSYLNREGLKRLPIFLVCVVPQQFSFFLVLIVQTLYMKNRTGPNHQYFYVINRALCQYISYKDSEVAWGAGDVSCWGQGLGDVFNAERCGQDSQGEPDHQIALRAFKGPAVTWINIRLTGKQEDRTLRSHTTISEVLFSRICYSKNHLDDNTWRLGEVPKRQAE